MGEHINLVTLSGFLSGHFEKKLSNMKNHTLKLYRTDDKL